MQATQKAKAMGSPDYPSVASSLGKRLNWAACEGEHKIGIRPTEATNGHLTRIYVTEDVIHGESGLALELMLRYPHHFTPLKPQSVAMRTLGFLVEQRRLLVDDKKRLVNRLGNTLKQYYPQALAWFEQHHTRVFADFLLRWPTLKQAKRARKTTLETFFREHNVRFATVIAERGQAIQMAMPLTEDPAVITPHQLLAEALVEQLREVILQAIDRFDAQIAILAPTLPDYTLFHALLGSGPILTPRLLAAFGEQRERFARASNCNSIPAWRRSPSAVARRAGCTGAGNARSSSARPSSSGRRRRSTSPSGPAPSIASSAPRAVRTKWLCEPWPSNGSASCIAAGKPTRPMLRAIMLCTPCPEPILRQPTNFSS